MRLTFVTGNDGKFREASGVLNPLGYKLSRFAGGYPEIQADTLEEVAHWGAKWLEGELDGRFFLEDAGLFVDELDGFPGVYSSYVYDTLGCPGILRLMQGAEDHGARFEAVIAYHDGEEIHLFDGAVEGRIGPRQRGEHGFGFDPIFIPDGSDRTFAQISSEAKSEISHRGRALEAFASFLEDA